MLVRETEVSYISSVREKDTLSGGYYTTLSGSPQKMILDVKR